MSKVLVDRVELEEAAKWLEVHSSSSGSAEAFAAEALREAIAQPAEAEGVGALDELLALFPLKIDKQAFVVNGGAPLTADGDDEFLSFKKVDAALGEIRRLAEQARAALSAVTAERDRLQASEVSLAKDLGEALRQQCADMRTIDQLRAEVEWLRKDAERWCYVRLQGDDTHWLNLLRVDLDEFGGNINAAVDALIDGEAPAMAAKEA